MFLQVISVLGALMVLGAYFGYQRGWLGKEQRLYSLLNTLGAGLLCWVALVDGRWGFVLIEGAWTLMSLPALIRPPRPSG
ncbi:MAG TPA: hypothetical protein VF092_07500 [Longimicrobium sp.]